MFRQNQHVTTAPNPSPPAPIAETRPAAPVPSDNWEVFVRALISALVYTLALAALATLIMVLADPRAALWSQGVALFIFCLLGMLAWFWHRELTWIRESIWEAERMVGVDLDGDGEVGDPQPHPVLIHPAASTRQGAPDPDAEAEYRRNFETFIRTCEARGTAEKGAARQVAKDRYDEFRDTLIGAGYAEWVNPRYRARGWRLKMKAATIIRQMWYGAAGDAQTPLPQRPLPPAG